MSTEKKEPVVFEEAEFQKGLAEAQELRSQMGEPALTEEEIEEARVKCKADIEEHNIRIEQDYEEEKFHDAYQSFMAEYPNFKSMLVYSHVGRAGFGLTLSNAIGKNESVIYKNAYTAYAYKKL